MKAFAVIGMNYGDEGKGHITNFFSDDKTLNIRFNGGSQASHAVFLSDGRFHIFHHFGSGSLRGARTLLASHFIVNPLIFVKELQELSSKIRMREVFIDPRCRVTTPFDMILNEFNAIYHKKNNTCGVGINETVERSMYRQLKINMSDFKEKSDDDLRSILNIIRNEYVPYRVKELKLPHDEFNNFFRKCFDNENKAIESFLKIRQQMINYFTVVWPDDDLIDKFLAKDKDRKIIFEAGQGMLLDQNRKEFMPYLTRSSTGIRNVAELLKTVKTPVDLDVYLVTRAYLTRHGDGPIWNHETDKLPFAGIEDQTNFDNQWQGKMRYGFLNYQWYCQAIEETEKLIDGSVNVAMTCLDHTGNGPLFYSSDGNMNLKKGSIEDFPRLKIISKGKTENDCFFKTNPVT